MNNPHKCEKPLKIKLFLMLFLLFSEFLASFCAFMVYITFNLCKPFNALKTILVISMSLLSFVVMWLLPNMLSYADLTLAEFFFTLIVIETSYPVFMGFTKAFEQIKRIEN